MFERVHPTGRSQGHRQSRFGFTLIELITALAIMGVAITIFVSLLRTTVDMEKYTRTQRVAAHLAQAQLDAMLLKPETYRWPDWTASGDGLQRVFVAGEEDAERPRLSEPKAMPVGKQAFQTESRFYDEFWWEAYARPLPASAIAAVTEEPAVEDAPDTASPVEAAPPAADQGDSAQVAVVGNSDLVEVTVWVRKKNAKGVAATSLIRASALAGAPRGPVEGGA